MKKGTFPILPKMAFPLLAHFPNETLGSINSILRGLYPHNFSGVVYCELSQTKRLLFHKGCTTPQHLPKKTSSILFLHQKHLCQAFLRFYCNKKIVTAHGHRHIILYYNAFFEVINIIVIHKCNVLVSSFVETKYEKWDA